MSAAPAALSSLTSLRACTNAFRAADAPSLDDLVGQFRALPVGPAWLRHVTPVYVSATGMPRWWGKEFDEATWSGPLPGRNLLLRDGDLTPSLALSATTGTSRVDGRPAVVTAYESTAPWPWRHVEDELRSLPDGRLIGLGFGLVPVLPTPAPFVLERT